MMADAFASERRPIQDLPSRALRVAFKEFTESYEKMATYIVPRSARLLAEDADYGLYRVVCLKKTVDEFKAGALPQLCALG